MGKYIDIGGLSRVRVLQALYAEANSAGLGAVRMVAGVFKGESQFLTHEQAEKALEAGRKYDGVSIDYLNGRRMKLWFPDRWPHRLYCSEYNECSNRSASVIVDELRAEVPHGA